ncbi:ABC transporter ATP-binding protein [Marinicrinis sediminis]|uniref:ABC transporter ATP-binding protein n=1 Tax=Marinicrinis sediminis TaxID=1652465 RepID=A0ABW5R5D5_9BACL
MESQVWIKLSHVNRSFGTQQVLHDISMQIPRQQICGLLGPSGSGKTTLVKLIAGIDTASQGTVHVMGEKMPQFQMLSKLGYMAQSDALYNELSALDNLIFFGELYGLRGKPLRARIEEVMSLVNLSEHLHKKIHQYSGGMKRRLSLAISLLHSPSLLILDEPTVGIDPILRKSIWKELNRLCTEEGVTILVTTHVMDEATHCDLLGFLRAGHLTAFGSPQELMQKADSDSIEEAFLIFGNGGNAS